MGLAEKVDALRAEYALDGARLADRLVLTRPSQFVIPMLQSRTSGVLLTAYALLSNEAEAAPGSMPWASTWRDQIELILMGRLHA